MKFVIKSKYLDDDESIPYPLRNIELAIGDGIKIYTKGQDDGYGSKHWDEYINYIQLHKRNNKIYNALEWCCGPAYFSIIMLKLGIADKMIMADIHAPLEKNINSSLKASNLYNRGQFICSDNFKNIPKQKFDLIIGNPPHFNWEDNPPNWNNPEEYELCHEDRKFVDNNWNIHKDFFNNVNNYLKDNGDIILMENTKKHGSDMYTFIEMLKKNNLKYIHAEKSKDYPDDIWYIHIRKDL